MKVSIGCTRDGASGSPSKLLFVGIVVASILAIVSAAPPKPNYEVCQSQACKDIAEALLSGMDTRIDPCTDFYRHTCGNWAKQHQGESHSTQWGYFGIISNKTNHRLRDLLETGWVQDESTSVKKAKQLYRACMDTNTIENKGVMAILSNIDRTGGWPMITNPSVWKTIQKPWQSVDADYNSIVGHSPIFNVIVSPDFKSSDKNVIKITPYSDSNVSPTPISRDLDQFFNAPTVANYIQYTMEVARLFAKKRGFVVTEDQLEKDARGIVLFESLLKSLPAQAVSGTMTRAEASNVNTFQKTMTLAEFQAFYDSARPKTAKGKINWLERIRTLFAVAKSVKIDSSEKVTIHNANFFRLLVALLDDTPERDIVNTIQWWFVKQTLKFTNKEMLDISRKYAKGSASAALHPRSSPPRWLECVTTNELQHPLGYAYVQKYFPKEAKAAALDMVNEIELEMEKEISRSTWLDDNSRKAAKEKLKNMAKVIGYPDWFKDPAAMDERYDKLAIGSFYLENMLLVKQFKLKQDLESLRKPVDRWLWVASPIAINAFYAPLANSLTFPAGILQMPFFDAEHPDAINYGGIGVIIGHEITHGFDNIGSQFDHKGNAVKWWSSASIAEYQKKSQCFVDQFDRFRVTINNVAYYGLGQRTLGENVADTGGTRAAFEAFKTHIKRPGHKVVKLPGLEHLSEEQLFFVSYAGTLCENIQPSSLLSQISYDPHSPAFMRVLGTLSNSEGFSESFKCPTNSAMNPTKKCSIWH